MRFLFKNNKITFGFIVGVIVACFITLVTFLFDKVLLKNVVWYYLFLFFDGLPLVLLIKLNLSSRFVYLLIFPYFVTLSLIAVTIKLKKKYWFFIIIFLIHIISAFYYNQYLKNATEPLRELIESSF